MDIRNKADWIESAKEVVPLLPDYMATQSGNVDPGMVEAELNRLVSAEDWLGLHARFEQIWQWLPDSPSIHRHPFGRLCDLCSEAWVFAEEAGERSDHPDEEPCPYCFESSGYEARYIPATWYEPAWEDTDYSRPCEHCNGTGVYQRPGPAIPAQRDDGEVAF